MLLYTSDDSRQYVENQWSYSTKTYDEGEMTQTDALDEFLIRIHNETFCSIRYDLSGCLESGS